MTIDPVEMLRQLTPEQLVERLQQLGRETDAIKVLLRAVRARERQEDKARTKVVPA